MRLSVPKTDSVKEKKTLLRIENALVVAACKRFWASYSHTEMLYWPKIKCLTPENWCKLNNHWIFRKHLDFYLDILKSISVATNMQTVRFFSSLRFMQLVTVNQEPDNDGICISHVYIRCNELVMRFTWRHRNSQHEHYLFRERWISPHRCRLPAVLCFY